MRYFWTRGRIGWPTMALVVFHTLLLLAFDYVWRLVQIPFLQLLLIFAGIWVVGIIAIVGATARLSRVYRH